MFKIMGELMLEVHETQRLIAYKCLSLVDVLCVKLMRKLEK